MCGACISVVIDVGSKRVGTIKYYEGVSLLMILESVV